MGKIDSSHGTIGDVKYYLDDGRIHLAVADDLPGIFRLFPDSPGSGPWVFFPTGSPEYDAFHQTIFRQFKAQPVDLSELDPQPPPVPPAPLGPFPTWAERQGQGDRFPASKYPFFGQWVEDSPYRKTVVHVLLHEDLTEPAFGDGKFLYFHSVTGSMDDATQYIDSQRGDKFSRYTVRSVTIAVEDGFILSPDFESQIFEHFSFEEVLSEIEKVMSAQLSSGSAWRS